MEVLSSLLSTYFTLYLNASIIFQIEMEEKMTARVQEGEEWKSYVSIVAEVMTKHRPSSKFLKNVGL